MKQKGLAQISIEIRLNPLLDKRWQLSNLLQSAYMNTAPAKLGRRTQARAAHVRCAACGQGEALVVPKAGQAALGGRCSRHSLLPSGSRR